jgi:hypothetical protein
MSAATSIIERRQASRTSRMAMYDPLKLPVGDLADGPTAGGFVVAATSSGSWRS